MFNTVSLYERSELVSNTFFCDANILFLDINHICQGIDGCKMAGSFVKKLVRDDARLVGLQTGCRLGRRRRRR